MEVLSVLQPCFFSGYSSLDIICRCCRRCWRLLERGYVGVRGTTVELSGGEVWEGGGARSAEEVWELGRDVCFAACYVRICLLICNIFGVEQEWPIDAVIGVSEDGGLVCSWVVLRCFMQRRKLCFFCLGLALGWPQQAHVQRYEILKIVYFGTCRWCL